MNVQQRTHLRLSISLIGLILAIFIAIYSWSRYVWLRFFDVIFIVLPIMVLILCIIVYANRISKIGPYLLSKMSPVVLTTLFVLMLLLASAAPIYSRWQAKGLRQQLTENLSMNLIVENEKIQLESGIGDVGLPRHILTTYKITEPLDNIEQDLIPILTTKLGWKKDENELRFSCPVVLDNHERSSALLDNLLYVKEDNLTILLFANGSQHCVDK